MATKITHNQPTPILATSQNVAPPTKASTTHAMATKITHNQPTPILATSQSVATPTKATALHVNVLQQLTGWVTSWFVKETLFQKAVKSGSLTITTAHGSILLEYREDFGRYSLGMVDEYGKITLIHAKNQISLQREALPYLEKIERQNGLIAQATRRNVSALRHSLEDAGLIEEERGVITFKDGGALIKFTGDDRDEKLALYLRWVMPEEAKPSTFERAMMGVVGLTMLGSVIAPAFEAISRMRAQFFPDNETISRLRSHLSPHSLECTAGLVVSGLCVASGQNKELCVALPMLSCLGKAFAEIVVVNPIPDQMAYPGKDFTLTFNDTSVFHQTDPSLSLTFSAKQADGSPLPSWLELKFEPTIVGKFPPTTADNIAPPIDAEGIYVSGNIAYMSDFTAGLLIVSVANPSSPSLLGSFTKTGGTQRLYVLDDKAYLTNLKFGIQIISVTNPKQPTLLGSFLTYANALNVFTVGDIAYLADDVAGLKIISVTDPTHPTLLSTFSTYDATDVYVAKDVAYIAEYCAGLKIISVTDPAHPTLLSTFPTTYCNLSIYVVENVAYLANWSNFLTISVANPAQPTLLGSLMINQAIDVYVLENIAYVVSDNSDLLIISVADPAHPSLLGSLFISQNTALDSVYVLEDKAYVADANVLSIISVADPAHPSLLGSLRHEYGGSGLYVVGNIAYVGASNHPTDGTILAVVSVENPSSPFVLGSLPIPTLTQGIYVTNNIAYVANYDAGLQIISVKDSANPSSLGSIGHADEAKYAYVIEDKAYLANGENGLYVISVANPSAPTLLGSITLFCANDVDVVDNIAYVAAGKEGLKIISVTDSSHPSILGTWATPDAEGIQVIEDKAYIADCFRLQIISIANPAQPSFLGSLPIPDLQRVSIVNDRAYMLRSGGSVYTENFLYIASIENLAFPNILGSLRLYYPRDIYMVKSLAYIADSDKGWKIVDCSTWQFAGTTPIKEFGKSYHITLTAQNSLEEKASTTFLLDVYDEGPHVVSPIPDQTVHIGHVFDFTVPSKTFTDPYGDVLKYSSTLVGGQSLPSWLHFNTTTERFKSAPIAESDIKDWPIEVKASDPYAKSAATDFTLSALHLGPSILHRVANQTLEVGHPLAFTIPEDTFLNRDDTALAYSSKLFDDQPLPTWLYFNTATREFSGTTQGKADVQDWNIAVRVDDPYGKYARTNFFLDVYKNGIKVDGTIPQQQIFANVPFEYTFPEGLFIDKDRLNLKYTALLLNGNPLPPWMTLDSETKTFSGKAPDNALGLHQIRLFANDHYSDAHVDFEILAYPFHYQPPTPDKGISNQKAYVGQLFTLTIPNNAFTNPSHSKLTYSAFLNGGKPLPRWLSFNRDLKTFSGSPRSEEELSITVKVTDSYQGSADITFSLKTINQTLKTIKTIFLIGSPIVSVLGVLTTVYINRVNIRNWRKKKEYQLPDETTQIGDQFTHKIKRLIAQNVGEIKVFMRKKKDSKEVSIRRKFLSWWNDNWEEISDKKLPPWLEYDPKNNALCSIPEKMEGNDAGDYKIQISNRSLYRFEEFILHIQGPASLGSVQNADFLAAPPQDTMRQPLLKKDGR